MLAEIRQKSKFLENFLGNVFSKLGLTSNQFTLLSVVFAVLTAYFLIKLKFVLAFICFFAAGILDLIDGAVARRKGLVSKKGAYLDTVVDRYVEIIILLGFLFLPLPKIIFPSYVWIFLSLTGSIMTTYVKAAAKEKEMIYEEMKTGFFGRTERMIAIGLAILLGIYDIPLAIYAIIALAVSSNITALQRMVLAFKSAEN